MFRMPRYNRPHISNIIDKDNRESTNSMEGSVRSGLDANIPEFGNDMKQHFLLGSDEKNQEVAFCNHGSYGATPKYVMEKRFELLREAEINPDLWYRSEMLKREILSTDRLAEFVGASSPTDIVYVDNVTEAMNIILKVSFNVCTTVLFLFIYLD